MEIEAKIEHHFLKTDIIPKSQWVDSEVPIAVSSDSIDCFIEPELGNPVNVVLNFGGLSVTIKKEDFEKAIEEWRLKNVR